MSRSKLTKNGKVLEDDELELNVVVGVDPVLGRLPDKSVLRSSSTGISHDGVSTSADEVIQPRQLNDDGVLEDNHESTLLP